MLTACCPVLHGHKTPVWDVAMSVNGKVVVSGDRTDITVRLWGAESGKARLLPLVSEYFLADQC